MNTKKSAHEGCIDYIEFTVTDLARTKTFFGEALGWTFKDYGDAYCEFSDGRMKGGFVHSPKASPGGPVIILYGTDLESMKARITAAGGIITNERLDFPGGWRFHFTDPDGYAFAVWTES